MRGLSLVAVSGSYSSLQCMGFSLRWLLLLQSAGSRHTGFSSSVVVAHRLSCSAACGNLPGPRVEPVCPVLAGGFFFFFFINLFIYLFLTVLGLRFCARAFSSCGERGPLFIAVRGPITVADSPVAEHRLQTHRLSSCGSRAQLLRGMWESSQTRA